MQMKWKALVLTVAMFEGLAFAQQPQAVQQPQTPVSGSSEYRLGPEDVVRVWVWREPDLLTTVMVRPDGRISLPLINEVDVSGRTAAEIQEELTTRYSEYLGDPMLSVIVTEINNPQISVLGKVRNPGRHLLRQQLTIFDAIALSGGFTEFANRDEVIVIRPSSSGIERITLNLSQMLEYSTEVPLLLRASDTIYVK